MEESNIEMQETFKEDTKKMDTPDMHNRVDTDIVADFSNEFTNYDIFSTREELLRWARQVGRQHGMVLTIKTSNNGNNRRRRPYVILACERAGSYRPQVLDDIKGKRKRETGTKKCQCPFELKGTKLGMDDEEVGWELEVICGTHNHTNFENMEGHSFAGRLSSDEMALVEDMSKGLVKPKDILVTLKQRDASNATVLKTVYNARQKLRVKEKAGRSQMQLLMGKLAEHNYREWHRSCDKSGELSDMLWAHPTSINLIRSFPYVLIMDCTYKTNRYRLPLLEIVGITSTDKTFSVAFAYLEHEKAENYEWVLRRLAIIMEGCPAPNVVVTDRELGLMKAIAVVYPSSRHMLCKWHISKNILANCKKMFDPEKWKSFEEELFILFKEESEESFNYKWSSMINIFGDNREALTYVSKTWLEPYKDKFVSAWTDTCMHLGNYTSNRAESSHAKLKRQLRSSQGNFADNWHNIDKLLMLQHTEIKASFEKSKNVYQHSFNLGIFKELRGFVSIKALEMIKAELKSAQDVLTGHFETSCKCNIRATHGLPCAHELYDIQLKDIPIPLDCIDSHWKTLSMEPAPISKESEYVSCADDIDEFVKFFEEKDTQQKRVLVAKLREIFKPNTSSLIEPSQKIVTRGRPGKKIDTSTRRDPSAFEYVESNQDNCSLKDIFGQKSGKAKHAKLVSVDATISHSQPLKKLPVHKTCVARNMYFDQIPKEFREYVIKIHDVTSDGNCGFRVVASFLGLGEDNWAQIRVDLLEELRTNNDSYMQIHKSPETLEELAKSIDCFRSPVGKEYWMTFPEFGHLIASRYNIVLHYFSLQQCLTFLPLRSKPVCAKLRKEVAMAFVNQDHFVHVTLKKSCPVPPIANHWLEYHEQIANDWDSIYQSRIKKFRNLVSPSIALRESIDLV